MPAPKQMPKQIAKPAPKQTPKPAPPQSFAEPNRQIIKPNNLPKETYKPLNLDKNRQGDLVSSANPRAASQAFFGFDAVTDNDLWIFKPNITLQDGSRFDPPVRKRTY